MKYKACIIGCGSIGTSKPDKYDSPTTENILTLAHAFYKHPDIILSGLIDIDESKVNTASEKWAAEGFKYLSDYYHGRKKDNHIVAVCLPTSEHLITLLNCIQYKPKLVIAEKPFCINSIESEIVVREYKKAGIPLVVDYIRNWDIITSILKQNIDAGVYGEILNARITYTRGLSHEGCHGINLFNKLFGEYREGIASAESDSIQDHFKNDLTYGVYLSFDKCRHCFLAPADGRSFSIFEFEMLTEKAGRIRLSDHGLYLENYAIEPEKTYGDYNALSNEKTIIKTELNTALLNLADNCVQHLDNGQPLKCTGEDVLNVHCILNKIKGE